MTLYPQYARHGAVHTVRTGAPAHKANTLYPGALDVGVVDAQQAESYSSHNQLNRNIRGAPRQRPAAAQK